MRINIHNQTVNDERKNFYKTVAGLVLPLAFQNLISVGAQGVNVLMLGWVGQQSLSAASLAGQVQYVHTLFLFGIYSGASVLIAQYWGLKDRQTISKLSGLTIRFAMSLSFIFFLISVLIPEQLMLIFTSDSDMILLGAEYLRYLAPGFMLVSFSNTYLNLVRSVERVRVTTAITFVCFVCSIGLNAVFIFGFAGIPAMGIAGAGLALTLARVIEFSLSFIYFRRVKPIAVSLNDLLGNHKGLMKDFFRYAGPTTLNELLWGLAIAANSVIIGRMGSAVIAANSVAQIMRQLATVISFGLANATAVIIGKQLGRSDFTTAKLYARRMVNLTIVFGGVGASIIYLFRPYISNWINIDTQAEEFLLFALLCMTGYSFVQAFNATMIIGIFRGGGDTRFGLLADVLSMWSGSLLLGALARFVFGWPAEIVYIILLSEEYMKVPFVIWRYFQRKWMKNVTREKLPEP